MFFMFYNAILSCADKKVSKEAPARTCLEFPFRSRSIAFSALHLSALFVRLSDSIRTEIRFVH